MSRRYPGLGLLYHDSCPLEGTADSGAGRKDDACFERTYDGRRSETINREAAEALRIAFFALSRASSPAGPAV